MSESSVLTLEIGGDSEEAVASISQVAEAFAAVQSASADAVGGLDAAGGATSDVGDASGDAKTKTDGLGVSMSGVGQAGTTLLGSITPLVPGLSGVANAGVSAAGGLGNVAASAAAGVTPIGMMVEVAATLAVGLLALGHAGAEFEGNLARMAGVTGMAVPDLVIWTKAIEDAGGSTETFNRSALFFERTLQDTQDQFQSTGTQTKAYSVLVKELGVSMTDGAGHNKTFAEAFPQVMSALAGVADETTRNVMLQTLFGRTGRDMIPLFTDYAEHLHNAEIAAKALGLTTEQVQAIHKEYSHDMQVLSTEFQEIAISVAPTFIKVLGAVADAFKFGVDHAGTFWEILKVGAAAAAGPIGMTAELISKLVGLGNVFDVVKSIVEPFWDVFKSSAESAIHTVIDLINALIDAWNNIPIIGSIASVGNINPGGMAAHPAGSIQLGPSEWLGPDGTTYARASGGPVDAGQLYQVNENGTEYFRPSMSGDVIPIAPGAWGNGSGGGVTIINNFSVGTVIGTSHDQLFREIDEHIREGFAHDTTYRGYR